MSAETRMIDEALELADEGLGSREFRRDLTDIIAGLDDKPVHYVNVRNRPTAVFLSIRKYREMLRIIEAYNRLAEENASIKQ